MDISYNLCASFCLQFLHRLLLNPQNISKYFGTLYQNLHIFLYFKIHIMT